METDSDADVFPDRDPLWRRLGRGLVLVAPPVATVGALLGVAVVAPGVGLVLLLLASSVAGLATTALKGGSLSTEAVEESHEMGMDLDRSGVGGTPPKATFVTVYIYGVGIFGFLGLLFTVWFLV